jgi:hypothetical protein
VEQILVQWSHMPLVLATWENLVRLREQFPQAPAWGHAGSEEGGSVTAPPVPTDVTGGQDIGSSSPGRVQPLANDGPPSKRKPKPNTRIFGPMWQV